MPVHHTLSQISAKSSHETSKTATPKTRSKEDVGNKLVAKPSSKQLPIPMDHKRRRKMRLIFTRKTTERQLFMEELKTVRKERQKRVLKNIKKSVGPTWYQVLSTRQRAALDKLEFNIKHDLISARPYGTMSILSVLNISPLPHVVDVFESIDKSQGNPMAFFAILFYTLYDHEISAKRYYYDLNQRVILSSIFYLSLPELKRLLAMKFAWNGEKSSTLSSSHKKQKARPESPYLWKTKAPMWLPEEPQRKKPDPLPDLGWLNAPFQQEPSIPRPPPPPPPPPPKKKTLDIDYCMQLAGYYPVPPRPKEEESTQTPPEVSSRRRRPTKMILKVEKKIYGIDRSLCPTFRKTKRKPRFPESPLVNEHNLIMGIFFYRGIPRPIIGNMVRTPLKGHIIHGGHVEFQGAYVMLHLGIKDELPRKFPPPCTCMHRLEGAILEYVKKQKCKCGHRYDFKNEGDFTAEDDEEPYFLRPSSRNPYQFRMENIFQRDREIAALQKEIHTIWDEDSLLGIAPMSIDSHDVVALAREDLKRRKKESKYKRLRDPDCLGSHPKVEDYLRCSVRQFRLINIAARLPDIHKTRELKEWMRMRLYGPLSDKDKRKLNKRSTTDWAYLKYFENEGLGVARIKLPDYLKKNIMTNWQEKDKLIEKFKKFTHKFRVKIYKKNYSVGNLYWATMCQPEFPDKHFRDIYFSYMISQVNDVNLSHPYSIVESMNRKLRIQERRIVCVPKGAADVDKAWTHANLMNDK
ncbi:hypothetical protein NE865_05717 [Phthorimaea operculella]|nr:hypothetical protein NE865_05717 [Phthorimaea operculella]